MFPLVRLPKKFKEFLWNSMMEDAGREFPLVRLPKKFKVFCCSSEKCPLCLVSISSTSEEVQRLDF